MSKPFNEVALAQQYVRKAQSSKDRGIEFSLTFAQFKRLMSVKRCAYLGTPLTTPNSAVLRPSDRTLDRIDSKKGYLPGNVVAVSHRANRFKAVWENPTSGMSFSDVRRIVANVYAKGG